jgi:hypothetical protein
MEDKYDLLEPAFKRELTSLVDYIKGSLKVKQISKCNNGVLWAELVSEYVNTVNTDKELALENMYVTAAEAALCDLSQKLIADYKREMEEQACSLFPMEERYVGDCQSGNREDTLLSIHNRVMNPKLKRFQNQVDSFLPTTRDAGDVAVERKKESLLQSFRSDICQLSTRGDEVIVMNGVLHQFVVENYRLSREHSRAVEASAFKHIRLKIANAAASRMSIVDDIIDDVLAAEEDYHKRAIGPARVEIGREVRCELESSLDLIQSIPGCPTALHSTSANSSCITLEWVETNSHPGVVDCYELQTMSSDDRDWHTLPEHFHSQCAEVSNLKSKSKYRFRVRGVGVNSILGNWSAECTCSTTVDNVTRGAAAFGSFLGGMVLGPAAGLASVPVLGPAGIIAGLVGAPIVGGLMAKETAKRLGPKHHSDKGAVKELNSLV